VTSREKMAPLSLFTHGNNSSDIKEKGRRLEFWNTNWMLYISLTWVLVLLTI
jgi:hypothetical protein